MSGAERRKRKRQRQLANQAVQDLGRFLEATNDEALRLHHHARVRATHLRTRSGSPMPHSTEIQRRAAGLDADVIAVARLLRAVFIEGTAAPDTIGLDAAEVESLRQAARRALLVIGHQLREPSIEAEVADTAASALAVAIAPVLHRIVWGRYDTSHRPGPTQI